MELLIRRVNWSLSIDIRQPETPFLLRRSHFALFFVSSIEPITTPTLHNEQSRAARRDINNNKKPRLNGECKEKLLCLAGRQEQEELIRDVKLVLGRCELAHRSKRGGHDVIYTQADR